MGDRIGGPISREEEGRNLSLARVIRRGRPELEEVERGERREEEGQTP